MLPRQRDEPDNRTRLMPSELTSLDPDTAAALDAARPALMPNPDYMASFVAFQSRFSVGFGR